MLRALGQEEIADEMKALPRWTVENARLRTSFVFADFVEAFGFMTRVALLADVRIITPSGPTCTNA